MLNICKWNMGLIFVFCGMGCADSLSIQSRGFQRKMLGDVETVAVVDFVGDIGGQAFADLLTMQLMKAGYRVVERDKLDRVMQEQKMGAKAEGQLDVTEKERLELIGRNISADLIITGELVRLSPARYERVSEDRVKFPPATCEVTGRAVDAATGRVVWTCVANVTATAKDGKYIKPMDHINEACAELVTSLKVRDNSNKSESLSGAAIEKMRQARYWER